jgi:hypothetical protein
LSHSGRNFSTQPSEDAILGLERLVVGRECNGFDRLPAARKARAFAELIRLGLAYGKVEEVAGQDFPVVTVQRVSSRGRRLRRTLRPVSKPLGFGWRLFWTGLLLGATLLGCLFLMAKATGS